MSDTLNEVFGRNKGGNNAFKDYPYTEKAIKQVKGDGNKTITDEQVNELYNIYQKEFFVRVVLKSLKKEKIEDVGVEEKDLTGNENLDKIIEKVKSRLKNKKEETKNTAPPEENSDATQEKANDADEENPVPEREEEEWMDNIISRVQNNLPIITHADEGGVMYPDVEETPEPVAPKVTIPHFEKISHAEKCGFERADDQWIQSKMTLLKKRGII